MIKQFIALVLLVGLTACSPQTVGNAVVPVSEIHQKKNQLLFLSLEVQKTDEGMVISVLDKKLVDGKLKRPLPAELNTSEYLIFEFQDQDGNTQTQVATENPLSRTVEVADENGKLQRQQIDLDKASLVLRIQFNKKMTNLKLTRSSGESLSIIPLDL